MLVILADLDECVYDSDCDLNAVCENTEGSYTCTCNYGYQGDGMDCSPIRKYHYAHANYSEQLYLLCKLFFIKI